MAEDQQSVWEFFRTELGKTVRVERDSEGATRVDVLRDGVWSQAPRGMIGLRLAQGTRPLTSAEIAALPFARVTLREIEIAAAAAEVTSTTRIADRASSRVHGRRSATDR
jgi:hypothetical protein